MTPQAVRLPEGVRSALDILASTDRDTEAWQLLARYLTSPEAVAATLAVGMPHITRPHLELLEWVTLKGGRPG